MEPAKRIANLQRDSIFDEVNTLVTEGKPINLGSGITEWDTPQFLKDFLYQSTLEPENQYGRSAGQPLLMNAIAKEYSPRFGRTINPMTEICAVHGSTGGLTNACMAFLEEGDEVVIFEPGYEYYFVQPVIIGAKLRTFYLDEPKEGSDQWTVNFEELEKLLNEKTRFIVLNTPHNPTGKVFNKEELEKLADIVKKWPKLIIIADEVYEHMCYDSHKHIRIGALEGMWDRVISFYSASKTFSCAGWRVGWAIGAEKLIQPLVAIQNWNNLNINRPAQIAIAKALNYATGTVYKDDKLYYDHLNTILQKKKDSLVAVLKKSWIKLKVFEPEGGFFILIDITEAIPQIPAKYFYKNEDKITYKSLNGIKELDEVDYTPDYAFVRWLAAKSKIISIPIYSFYNQSHAKSLKEYKGTNLVRFAFCKNEDTLAAVAECFTKE